MKKTAFWAGVASLALVGTMANAQITPITDEMLANPAPGDWISYGRNQENYRNSPLTQITPENVKNLQLVWARGMEPGIIQASPAIYDGVMYLVNPGDVIAAINAETGDLIWEHRRSLPDRATLMNALGERSRSLALYGDKVYFVSWDNHLVALNMSDGQVAFDIDRGDSDKGISNSSGPIVANGIIVAGSTCQYSDMGCYATGHDASTGEEIWRNYFIPKPGEEGDDTWGNDYEARWMTGAWGQFTYDPVTNLVFYGSTGTGPASEAQRGTPGGTLYGSNTRFAVRPETGEIVWRHQTLPRDNWDQECTFEMIVASTDVKPATDMDGALAINPNASGEGRRVLTGVPCKTGVMWQFDAETGEFLWARDTSYQNMISKIDANDGTVTVNEEMVISDVTKEYDACPTYLGGRDWPASTFNPESGIYFIPLSNVCGPTTAVDEEFTNLDVYNTAWKAVLAPGKENIGRIDAIDISTGKTVWSYEQPLALYAPLTSTATGLLFSGSSDRYFRALSQETGEILWETRLATAATGHTVSYEVNGRQFIAMTGGGSSLGNGMLNAASASAKSDAPLVGNAVYVFALPQ